jgi:hypothetical protein
MILDLEIRQRLAEFLADRLSLDEFEDWLVQESWNVQLSGDGAAERMVYAIELRLAEHSSGHLSVEDLRRQLVPFLQRYSVLVSFPGAGHFSSIQTGTSCSMSFLESPIRSFGIRSEEVFV